MNSTGSRKTSFMRTARSRRLTRPAGDPQQQNTESVEARLPGLSNVIRRLFAAGLIAVGIVFSMLALGSSSGAYPIQSGSLPVTSGTLAPGGTVTLTGSGFTPGAAVSIYVYSTPTLLSKTVSDATGSIAVAVTIPADLAPGSHTLQAIGPAPGGGSTDLTTSFTVPGSGASGGGGLPVTGFPAFTVLGVAVLAVLIGGTLVLMSRRRAKVSR